MCPRILDIRAVQLSLLLLLFFQEGMNTLCQCIGTLWNYFFTSFWPLYSFLPTEQRWLELVLIERAAPACCRYQLFSAQRWLSRAVCSEPPLDSLLHAHACSTASSFTGTCFHESHQEKTEREREHGDEKAGLSSCELQQLGGERKALTCASNNCYVTFSVSLDAAQADSEEYWYWRNNKALQCRKLCQ